MPEPDGPTRAGSTAADGGFYLGCWQRVGHYLWRPGMRQATYGDENVTPWGYGGLDCDAFNTRDWHVEKKAGWTAVGLEDRTVDSRPNSHSVFAFAADLTLTEAVERAEATFPEVFNRLSDGANRRDT